MSEAQSERRIISTEEAPAAIGPYSQAVVAGGMCYCSGQIALRPDGSLVEGEIEDEVRQAMDNLSAVLRAAGTELGRVVQASLFLADMADFARVNAVYAEYFPEAPPARACVAAAGLPKGVRFEVVATAQMP